MKLNRDRVNKIETGIQDVRNWVRDLEHAFMAVRASAIRAGNEIPPEDALVPHCRSMSWVGDAVRKLRDASCPVWFTDAELRAALENLSAEDLAGDYMRRLRPLPEFQTWAAGTVEIRWTRKAVTVTDLVLVETHAGRGKVVPEADRETWQGDGPAPWFRVELSLPWWLLATDDERERGLHSILASFGLGDHGPVIRKPDIVAHASTLGRYGLQGVRQASAIVHATTHPAHQRLLREHGFSEDGQGLLWNAFVPTQGNLLDVDRTAESDAQRIERHARESAAIQAARGAPPPDAPVEAPRVKRPRAPRKAGPAVSVQGLDDAGDN